ncbi:MAG: hypothetical protein ACLQGV_01530 [Bryobacteraceae bacterium]
MPAFKRTLVRTAKGASVQYEPVVLSVSLNFDQKSAIMRATGSCLEKLELSASDLKAIMLDPWSWGQT